MDPRIRFSYRHQPPRVAVALAALLVASILAGARSVAGDLAAVLARTPADSLVAPLHQIEGDPLRPAQGALAAMVLGQLHYARGDYRAAAEAFTRAAARLDPARKSEARYWCAMSWLALGEAGQARALFEELANEDSPRRTDATFGIALAWEAARRPEKALDVLAPLSRSATGEIAPAVLEHTLLLADRFQRGDLAADARRRLFENYPRSIEAARAGLLPPRTIEAHVELGPFPTEPRAHAAGDAVRPLGFTRLQPMIRGKGAERAFIVRVDGFPSPDSARHAAERIRRDLGIPAHVVQEP